MTWRERSQPGARGRPRTGRWNDALWALIWPRRVQRIMPTLPGVVLIALSLGIGMAAYNSSSNILFLTLALLLSCLIFSGVLSWLNVRAVVWQLQPPAALRVGHDAAFAVEVRNRKRFLPTYALVFKLSARQLAPGAAPRAETTLSARGSEVRAALAAAETAQLRGEVGLTTRLDPGGEARLEWVFQPTRRGPIELQLDSLGSLFPFGFLRKEIGIAARKEALVWPATIAYRRQPAGAARRWSGSEHLARAGAGTDLLALRRYSPGDSHRLIHWKASARTGQLLVRQFAAESAEGFNVWLRTDAGQWPRADQFETLLSFAASLAEDLFRAGQLARTAVNDGPATLVRRHRDLELFLDQLAVAAPADSAVAPATAFRGQANVLTFAPEGPHGVAAYVDGQLAAST